MTIALDPLPDRVDPTFAVCADGKTVGYIRYDGDDGAWVARTKGNATAPADIRRFASQTDAVRWLDRAVDGVIPRRARAA